jgi:septal ring factor EnvC (AmiA/AmiB activator)
VRIQSDVAEIAKLKKKVALPNKEIGKLKADLSENKTRVAESEVTIVLLQQENAELKESVEQGNFIIKGLKNECGHGIIRNYTKAFGFY